MTKRTSIFVETAQSTGLDVSDFTATERSRRHPASSEIDAAIAGSRFKSREPDTISADHRSTGRKPMVYRTGRNVVFSAKTSRETVEQFYALAEENGWKANETFERAVAALKRERNEQSD